MQILASGDRVGAYTLDRRIAVGGMGELWAAHDETDHEVALKVLLPHIARDPMYRDMFIDECRIAERLVHPNIIHSYGSREEAGILLQVTELVTGCDLRALLAETKRADQVVPIPLAIRIGHGIASGLAHAHDVADEKGRPLDLVHRDITPANILLDVSGRVLLIDFGIAKARDRLSRTATGVIKGKLGYLAPEQLLGQPLTPAVDAFGLGIVLWEMFALRRLFTGGSELEVATLVHAQPAPSLASIRDDVPDAISDLVDGLLERDPEDRPNFLPAIAAELAELLRQFPDETSSPSALGTFVAGYTKRPAKTAQMPVPDLRAAPAPDLADTLRDPVEHPTIPVAAGTERDDTVPIPVPPKRTKA
ncbi:MAG: serine/threonine-protein kinase [Myxococcota bacterium]